MITKIAKISILSAICLAMTNVSAFNLGDFAKKLQEAANKGAPAGANSGGGKSQSAGGMFDQVCGRVLGEPFQKVTLKESQDALIQRYFNVADSTEFEKALRAGVNVGHKGTLVNLRTHTPDLQDKKIKRLAESFLLDPSSDMLAQVIHFAQNGDRYFVEKEGSEWGDAQVLLAMVLMQYPDLVKGRGAVLPMLKSADAVGAKSNLARALIARAHLFGDYATKDLREFDGRIVTQHDTPKARTKTLTIEWAIENEPGWNRRQQYEEQLKMQADFVASMTKKKNARSRNDMLPRVVALLDKGDEINQMTAEALGAGPQIAQIQARIDQVKKEGSGEQNIVKVRASITAEAEAMLAAAMKKSPKLEGDAKAKLAAANKLRADNLIVHYGLVGEAGLKFISGEMGEVVNVVGPMLNEYMVSACTVMDRSVKLSEKLGDPPPAMDPKAVADAEFM